MRCVVQRVLRARVTVDGEAVGAIERGLMVLVGILEGDTSKDAGWVAHKLLTLRVFADDAGKMNLSLTDVGGSLLVVSQFTLAADIGNGARPSFTQAMQPDRAQLLFAALVALLREVVPVKTGRFGALMHVELVNDGPVTLWLDSS